MTPPTEEEVVAAKRGKWSVAGVPHKGWICVDIEDLGEPSSECEMCESQTIRYVHHMQHPDYPGVLQVSCVCAGHMEGNLAASRARKLHEEPSWKKKSLNFTGLENISQRQSSHQGRWLSRHSLSPRWRLRLYDRRSRRNQGPAFKKKLQDN